MPQGRIKGRTKVGREGQIISAGPEEELDYEGGTTQG